MAKLYNILKIKSRVEMQSLITYVVLSGTQLFLHYICMVD